MEFLTGVFHQIISVAGLVAGLGWGCTVWLAIENSRKERFAREDRATALIDAREAIKANVALVSALAALGERQARIEGLLAR